MADTGWEPAFCTAGTRPSPPRSDALHNALCAVAAGKKWQSQYACVDSEYEVDASVALVYVLDGEVEGLRRRFPHALLVAAQSVAGVDLPIVQQPENQMIQQLFAHAETQWERNLKVGALYREVGLRRKRMAQLSEIALSLSTQMEFDDLLQTILLEARRLAGCDAGSLYLLDESDDETALVFKLAQNDSVDIPFMEKRLPITSTSVAGYVAVSGTELDIPDVYDLPAGAPYQFNRSFDEEMDYRTRSMLVLPMRDHRGRVVGVLQFINRFDPATGEAIAFGEEIAELLRAVASQAAVSIQKNILIRDINTLFESFVQASVKTIEQRDPSTSGHSVRVAETTVALLEALPRSDVPRFSDLQLNDELIKEVRYAALLHDFGKVGVRENVLTKANKLSDDRLEMIHYRMELQKERLRRRAVEQELEMLHRGVNDIDVGRRRVHRELAEEISTLDDFFQLISSANIPNVLEDGNYQHLKKIREYDYLEYDGTLNGLITDDDLLALSVRRGSLTPEERREIESHVTHTREFLAVLPWPPELARVPEIASAHHEKLDGSGYPHGLVGEQIPLASRVMTVCDIYDALTAMDRPYKKAMPAATALEILEEEAQLGMLDTDMVQIFIASRTYELTAQSLHKKAS
ncbi:MAG: GAF domain-containing protein [Gammaproteobacteria bacterium]|nr:GAF domain-containing protein [Gammaproteobacteria bacterium]